MAKRLFVGTNLLSKMFHSPMKIFHDKWMCKPTSSLTGSTMIQDHRVFGVIICFDIKVETMCPCLNLTVHQTLKDFLFKVITNAVQCV